MAIPDDDPQDGLVYAVDLDGAGGGQLLDWDGVGRSPGGVLRWIHIDRTNARAQHWLTGSSGLGAAASRALLAEDTRPRFSVFDEGALLNLRGVNLNSEADPSDMVSIRMWITSDRIVSARRYRIMAVRDMRAAIEAGKGPDGIGAFVARLAAGLTERMEPVLENLDEELSDLEEELVDRPTAQLRRRLASVRRRAILFRRYISTQREALNHLTAQRPEWLNDTARESLSDTVDRVTRYVEDLDVLRERAFVLQDELTTRLTDHMNRIIYLLTIITGIFLPLGLLAGLFGINVGGMPGVDTPYAFWVVCGLMAAVGVMELFLLRFVKWL